MSRKCIKCGHVNPQATGGAEEACPHCGAIYSKLEGRVQEGMSRPMDTRIGSEIGSTRVRKPTPTARVEDDVQKFAEKMQQRSLYPTFRGLIGLLNFVFMAFAILFALAAFFIVMTGGGGTGGWVGGFLFSFGMAVFFFVVGRVTKEASLMLEDLSDAAVLLASRK